MFLPQRRVMLLDPEDQESLSVSLSVSVSLSLCRCVSVCLSVCLCSTPFVFSSPSLSLFFLYTALSLYSPSPPIPPPTTTNLAPPPLPHPLDKTLFVRDLASIYVYDHCYALTGCAVSMDVKHHEKKRKNCMLSLCLCAQHQLGRVGRRAGSCGGQRR